MKLSLVTIGNSRGFRIPQALIKQCAGADEFEVEMIEGNLLLKPVLKRGFELNFNNIEKMNDHDIIEMLKRTEPFTLAVSLMGATEEVKERIYENMSVRASEMIKEEEQRLNQLDARQLIIEMHRTQLNSTWKKMLTE